MENLTNEEKDYYELLVDLLDNGEISDSERNILNKRKEKYSISDSRASEIEEFAREERLQNLKPQNDSENSYYELILDFMENGIVSESNRKILNKRLEKYGITEARAKELEYFAKQEYLESKKVKFESEEEKEYYEFIVDLMENGAISENNRKILDKRKIKFGISETRAKELENFAKDMNTQNKICKGINTTNNNLDNIESEQKEYNDLYEQGNYHYDNEEYDKAIEIFKKVLEFNSNDDLNWYCLGRSYCQNGEYQEAINSLLKAVELNPDNELNWYWLGSSYNQNGQYQEAINSLLKAVELNPDNELNWRWLGRSYYFNNQYQEAINSLLKAVELNPNDDDNYYLLGFSYYRNGEYEMAIDSSLKAVELNSDSEYNWFLLGCSYYQNGEYEEAVNSLLKAVEINPNDYLKWYWLGLSYYNNMQYQEAINSLLKAVELNSNDAGNYYWLGRSYNDNEQYEKAIDSLLKATQLNSDDPENWYRLCISYHINRQYQDAINSGLKATQLNPDYAGNWAWLGSSYGMNGQYQEAKIAVSKALEIDPNYEFAKKLQSFLSSNERVSLDGVVSGISKGIDTLNELSGKIKPETIGMVVGAAKLVGKILGGSNKNK